MGLYRRKNSPYWWFSFKLTGGKRIQESTDESDKIVAQKIYFAKRSEYQNIKYKFDVPKIRLSKLFDDYIEKWAKTEKETYQSNIGMFSRMINFFGNIYAHELTKERIQEYRVSRLRKGIRKKDGVSKSTVNREMALLKHCFNMGIEWGKCVENPVIGVKFPSEKENKRTRFLDKFEKIQLLSASPVKVKRIIFFAMNTGLRLGEILNLLWDDINFENMTIRVRESKSKDQRFVNFDDELSMLLKSMPTISKYVFGNEKGKVAWSYYRKEYDKAVNEAGIRDFTFHDLRHTYASDLVMAGKNLKVIKDLLGHSSITLTERYSHVNDEHKKDAVKGLPKGLLCYTSATQIEKEISENQNRIDKSAPGQLAQLVEQATLKPQEPPLDDAR